MTQTNQPTALAAEQQSHLRKTLRRFDIVFLLIAAVVGLETLGQVSLYGAEAFTWALVLAVFFLVPYGLIFAETGAAFSEEGGAYTWVRDAFGRPAAAVAAILTWITQPVWVGGSMAFLAELGTTVALGILLDTLIVRSVLVTALNLDFGRRIWWPSKLWLKHDEDYQAPLQEPEPAFTGD